jgi:hypothetical protein
LRLPTIDFEEARRVRSLSRRSGGVGFKGNIEEANAEMDIEQLDMENGLDFRPTTSDFGTSARFKAETFKATAISAYSSNITGTSL